MHAAAKAYTNIALIKYFGKCDEEFNLPAAPSLSLTLKELSTETQIEFDPNLSEDTFWLNDAMTFGKALERVSLHLDRITKRPPLSMRARIKSWNNFPTASGLASSASGFAALTLAAKAAFPKNGDQEFGSLEKKELSILARQGSGSAARSLFGGLVLLTGGTPGQVDSSFACQITKESDWPELRLVIGIVSDQAKPISSTEAMKLMAKESPYYSAFIGAAPKDIQEGLSAIVKQDFEKLGQITERSALRMHAAMMATDPGILFIQGPTIEAFHHIRQLRKQGIPVWFTCDAGPHPKALTHQSNAHFVATALASVPGIQKVIMGSPGPCAHLLPWQERTIL